MKAGKCPTNEDSLTNCAFVNPQDFNDSVKSVFFYFYFSFLNFGEKNSIRSLKDENNVILLF
jgi:hypothetical protein